jgi:Na+-transporting NADH:ubiquinone oxidoreductase subunit NqrE
MTAYFLLLLATALVNNVVLVKFLGLCPFMGVSRSIDSALGDGARHDLRHHPGLRRHLDARALVAAAL